MRVKIPLVAGSFHERLDTGTLIAMGLPMFWTLLLCHVLADYPLQTDAVVQAKRHLRGIFWHVTIHLVTMLVVVVGLLQADWRLALPYLLALAACHFLIDVWKNALSSRLPASWDLFCYLQDQALHLLSISGICYWIGISGGLVIDDPNWAIPATAYLLVTHTWFVTERVLFFQKDPQYGDWVASQSWPRMIGRAVMLSAWYFGWGLSGLAVLLVGLLHHWMDLAGVYHTRALLIDLCVVATAMGIAALA